MGKSRVAAHRKTDEKLKSKRRDASKEVAKDPNKLKRPAIALFVVIFCCCSAAFDYKRGCKKKLERQHNWKFGLPQSPSKQQRSLHLTLFSTGMRRLESR